MIFIVFYDDDVVPSAPRGLQLKVTQDEPPVIVATWSAPRLTHGPVVRYKLTYGIRADNYIEERRFEGEKYRFTTGFLGALRYVTSQLQPLTDSNILQCIVT